MVVRREVFVAFIICLFSAAIVDAQPYSNPFGASMILERPSPNPERNHRHFIDFIPGGDDSNQPLRLFTAQTAQADDPQVQQTQDEIRERLEARIQALEAEWAAIKKEEAEINRIGQGGTLRGSNTKKFMKRTDDFSQRVMKYNTEKETLRKDIEAFETAVKNAAIAPLDTDSEDPAAKAAQTKAYLEKKREELTEEYRALKQEKQRIGRPDQAGPAADNLPTVNQQASQWNEKMKEFAKKRKTFNEAVQAFNEKTGQNVQPLPEP